MAITFKLAEHSIREGVIVVQILLDGNVVGVIYPDPETNGIKLVSVHFFEKDIPPNFDGEVVEDDGKDSFPPIPAIGITFKPRRCIILRGEIVYLE